MVKTLVFPHQLFPQHPAVSLDRLIVMMEHPLFFRQYPFHQQKIKFHRATMLQARDAYLAKGHRVEYIEAESPLSSLDAWAAHEKSIGTSALHLADPTDDWLMSGTKKALAANGLACAVHPDPNFLTAWDQVDPDLFKKGRGYFQTDFYVFQRKRLGILVDPKGRPEGGKWTFDTENRLKWPAKELPPRLPWPEGNLYVAAAAKYVEEGFSHHLGRCGPIGSGWYPTNRGEALAWLDDFVAHRLARFGHYEDAMLRDEAFLCHSVLSPLLNVGLIGPGEVVDKTMEAYRAGAAPLNAVEGIVRQIIGWREFIGLVYVKEGRKQRTRNFWGFDKALPAAFYKGETGLLPFDTVVRRVAKTGYAHHIERLMVLGNLMLLCEVRPDSVYQWFMEMFIDAYDWVMVPNIYGMSQFADGGLMTTKPYISGSNYLMKMGNWPKGGWQQTWDGLFWRFMDKHRDFFLQNPRLGMLVTTWDKMEPAKKALHLKAAEDFLSRHF